MCVYILLLSVDSVVLQYCSSFFYKNRIVLEPSFRKNLKKERGVPFGYTLQKGRV